MVNLGQSPDGRKVFGCRAKHEPQLCLGAVEIVDLDEGAAKRHACREIAGMDREPGAAGGDGVFVAAGPSIFFGQLCKSNRRRIRLDPASKLLDARIVWHDCKGRFMVKRG